MRIGILVIALLGVGTPAFADWHTVAPKGEHFSLKFPEAPERRVKDVTGDDGSVAKLIMYMAKIGFDDTAYTLSYGDRPVETPKPKASELFDFAEKSVAKRYRIISHKDGKFRGYPSRDFEGLALGPRDDNKVRGRLVLVGQRMYMMMVMLGSSGGTHDPDVETFLASLRIL